MSEHDDTADGRALRATPTGPASASTLDQLPEHGLHLPAQARFAATRQRRRNEAIAARLRAAVQLGRILAAHTTAELEAAIGPDARPRLTEAYEQLRAGTGSQLELPDPVHQLRTARPGWWGLTGN